MSSVDSNVVVVVAKPFITTVPLPSTVIPLFIKMSPLPLLTSPNIVDVLTLEDLIAPLVVISPVAEFKTILTTPLVLFIARPLLTYNTVL